MCICIEPRTQRYVCSYTFRSMSIFSHLLVQTKQRIFQPFTRMTPTLDRTWWSSHGLNEKKQVIKHLIVCRLLHSSSQYYDPVTGWKEWKRKLTVWSLDWTQVWTAIFRFSMKFLSKTCIDSFIAIQNDDLCKLKLMRRWCVLDKEWRKS